MARAQAVRITRHGRRQLSGRKGTCRGHNSAALAFVSILVCQAFLQAHADYFIGGTTVMQGLSASQAATVKGLTKNSRQSAVPGLPTGSVVLGVDTKASSLGPTLPMNFLSVSHEWTGIDAYAMTQDKDAWPNIFKQLGPNPILRVGGESAEMYKGLVKKFWYSSEDALNDPNAWQAMKELKDRANARFIINLPTNANKWKTTGRALMLKALTVLGTSILGFELGNEPGSWPTDETSWGNRQGLGAFDDNDNFVPGFDAWVDYYKLAGETLAGCSELSKPGQACPSSCKAIFIGPSWGTGLFMTEDEMRTFLDKTRCFLNSYSIHMYPPLRGQSGPPYTPEEIMQDDLMTLHRNQVAGLVQRLKGTHIKTVRMTEGSAHPFGGKAGITDSLTSALWVADYSMEMARAGMASVSLHWGKGGGPGWCDEQGKITGRGGPLYVGVETNYSEVPDSFCGGEANWDTKLSYPSPKASWYGYNLFSRTAYPASQASEKGSTTSKGGAPKFAKVLVGGGDSLCKGYLKVWPLVQDSQELRVMVINKNHKANCNVAIYVTEPYVNATLQRMEGDSTDLTTKVVTLGGQSFSARDGLPRRSDILMTTSNDASARTAKPSKETVPSQLGYAAPYNGIISFVMPASSGAILTAQLSKSSTTTKTTTTKTTTTSLTTTSIPKRAPPAAKKASTTTTSTKKAPSISPGAPKTTSSNGGAPSVPSTSVPSSSISNAWERARVVTTSTPKKGSKSTITTTSTKKASHATVPLSSQKKKSPSPSPKKKKSPYPSPRSSPSKKSPAAHPSTTKKSPLSSPKPSPKKSPTSTTKATKA